MRLQDILDDPPKLHGGGDVLFALADEVLRFIEGEVTERSRTLETGAGLSTVVFALKRAVHTSIVPDASQAERIREYCLGHSIPIDGIHFEIGRSEDVLPRLTPSTLDLVLIDGRHGFPTPFIDWFYTSDALRVGGLLLIDDTLLWTGDVLKRFLQGEREWRLERDFFLQTAVFRKLADGSHSKSWTEQDYLVRRTAALRRINRIRQKVREARVAADLIRNGQFRLLARKVLGGR
jgi:Methyltransferase domain